MVANKESLTKIPEITLPEEIVVKLGFGDNKITFNFRMLSLAEERQWANADAKEFDSKNPDPKKEYDLTVRKLSQVILNPLTALDAEGNPVPLIPGASASESVLEFFKDFTPAKERILVSAFLEYRTAMVPTKSFL